MLGRNCAELNSVHDVLGPTSIRPREVCFFSVTRFATILEMSHESHLLQFKWFKLKLNTVVGCRLYVIYIFCMRITMNPDLYDIVSRVGNPWIS